MILWGHTGHRAAADAMHRHHDKGRACRKLGCVDTLVPIMWKEGPVSRDECNRFSDIPLHDKWRCYGWTGTLSKISKEHLTLFLR